MARQSRNIQPSNSFLAFPGWQGGLRRPTRVRGNAGGARVSDGFRKARFASCSPHILLKDVKHIQRMSVATNRKKAARAGIWLPTGIERIHPNTWCCLHGLSRAQVESLYSWGKVNSGSRNSYSTPHIRYIIFNISHQLKWIFLKPHLLGMYRMSECGAFREKPA